MTKSADFDNPPKQKYRYNVVRLFLILCFFAVSLVLLFRKDSFLYHVYPFITGGLIGFVFYLLKTDNLVSEYYNFRTKAEQKQTKFSNAMHREGEVCTAVFVTLFLCAISILGALVYGYLNTGIEIKDAKDLYKFIPYIPITIAGYIAFAVICRYSFVYSRLSLQYRHKARLIELTDLDDLSPITRDAIYRELISIDIPEPRKQNDLQDMVDAVIKIKELSK